MVKRRKAYLLFTLMIMAVLSLSVFSFCAYAAEDQQQDNTSAAVQSVDAEENLSLLKFEISGKQILIAVGVSILATGLTVFFIWNSYKTNGQSEPYTYKKKAPLQLSDAEDLHVDTIVNRRKIERNNR